MGSSHTKALMDCKNSCCHDNCISRDKMCTRFEILVVMEISGYTSQDVVQWIVERVRGRKGEGRAELLAHVVKDETRGVTSVYLGAEEERYLRVAEYMKIKKMHKIGYQKHFRFDDLKDFVADGCTGELLTCNEKQRIIQHELDSIHAKDNDSLAYHGISFYKGESIISRLQHEGIITKLFPLHRKVFLNKLIPQWYLRKGPWLTRQPLDMIREYFGETIGMYFTFIGFYTVNLMLPAAIGFICSFFKSSLLLPLFCLLNMVWSTVFLESWKRRSAEQAYHWGTFRLETFEEPRSAYHGPLITNPVTQRLEPKYSAVKHYLKISLVSCPVMIIGLMVSIAVMLGYFWMCDYVGLLAAKDEDESITIVKLLLNQSPNILYAVVIQILNYIYTRIAMALNDWENHRLQSSYENHLVTKLALFAFANSFSPLFYVAFYLRDIQLLRSHLVILMITHMLVQQLFEAVVPYVTYRFRKGSVTRQRAQSSPPQSPEHGPVTKELLVQADADGTKAEYARPLDDYLELFIQFGYVFLFSAVFPLAALLALLNNLIEIRTDGFKLCRILRRPFSQPASGIGVWQVAFELLSTAAVITNCALIAMSPTVQQYTSHLDTVQTFFFFVVIEHAVLFIKAGICYLFADEPESVRIALAIEDHHSKNSVRQTGVKILEKID